MERIGFVFTSKDFLYVKDGISLEMMYESNSQGDTTDTNRERESGN